MEWPSRPPCEDLSGWIDDYVHATQTPEGTITRRNVQPLPNRNVLGKHSLAKSKVINIVNTTTSNGDVTPRLHTASELQQPSCGTKECHDITDAVTQKIMMQAALSHAISTVHEAQDLRPLSPLPQGLRQLRKKSQFEGCPFQSLKS